MKRTALRLLAGARLALVIVLAAQGLFPAATSLHASTRPRYGGTLRVMMQQRVDSLDPREIPAESQRAAATGRLLSQVYERLVRLDEKGQPQPELAISWTHSPNFKSWEFKLRPNVKFHDGTLLTPGIVAGRLQLLSNDATAAVVGDTLRIESTNALPNLPYELTLWRNAIFKVSSEGQTASLVGTGPFKLGEFFPGRNATFIANEDHWAGRAFVDRIEVEMGANLREQAIAHELGKADIVELGPTEFRRATQAGRRAWASSPVELLAIWFRIYSAIAPTFNPVREAISLSIDRASIHTVLLQRQGEPAAALLPQWLSGYAFVFTTDRDLDRARQIWKGIAAPPASISIDFDAKDMLLQAIAERMVVNAREAGIPLRIGRNSELDRSSAPDAMLVRIPFSNESPATALRQVTLSTYPQIVFEYRADYDVEKTYTIETGIIRIHHVIPIAHLPLMYGLSPRVKNWMPTRMGEWRLADVWIEQTQESKTTQEKERGQAGVPVPREKH